MGNRACVKILHGIHDSFVNRNDFEDAFFDLPVCFIPGNDALVDHHIDNRVAQGRRVRIGPV
jgi:hypothetical protein